MLPFVSSFKSICRRQCVADLYFNMLLPCCCGLEYLCSVADPGGHCLREQAYFYCKFFLPLPVLFPLPALSLSLSLLFLIK